MSSRQQLPRERRRPRRQRLRFRGHLSRHRAGRILPLLDRKQRLAGRPVEQEDEAVLRGLRHRVHRPAVLTHRHQRSAAKENRDPKCRASPPENARAACRYWHRAPAAYWRTDCRPADWRHRNPPPRCRWAQTRCRASRPPPCPASCSPTDIGPRILGPRLVAEFARMRNRVKAPAQLPGPHIVRADIARRRRQPLRRRGRRQSAGPCR